MQQALTQDLLRYCGNSRSSTIGAGVTIGIHALVAGAFFLIPGEIYRPFIPTITIGRPIPNDPPPEQPRETTDDKAVPVDQPVSTVKPVIVIPQAPEVVEYKPPVILSDDGGAGQIITSVDPVPPVMIEAAIDPRHADTFQPDYPGTMIRMGQEGKVSLRVTIGQDGRVTGTERLFATNDIFWEATQRQAMRKWRFRPATRDGIAIASQKVLTVHFRLENR